MTTKRNELMQEVETYGNGLLSEDTIAYTVDILMECDPVPDSIDGIDIDSVIRAVECRGAEHLSDVYDLDYDYVAHDWFASEYAVHTYLHIGDVDRVYAENYALRYFSDLEWSIMYRVSFPGFIGHYSVLKDAAKCAYEHALKTNEHVAVLEVACTTNRQGGLEDRYVIRRISK